jgi:acyl carrier protein
MLSGTPATLREVVVALTLTAVSTDEVVDVVVDLLAEEEGRPASEVMAELAVSGADLAIDSLRIVEILTRVEERYGVLLPADPAIARSTRSVLSFAQAVVATINTGGPA